MRRNHYDISSTCGVVTQFSQRWAAELSGGVRLGADSIIWIYYITIPCWLDDRIGLISSLPYLCSDQTTQGHLCNWFPWFLRNIGWLLVMTIYFNITLELCVILLRETLYLRNITLTLCSISCISHLSLSVFQLSLSVSVSLVKFLVYL